MSDEKAGEPPLDVSWRQNANLELVAVSLFWVLFFPAFFPNVSTAGAAVAEISRLAGRHVADILADPAAAPLVSLLDQGVDVPVRLAPQAEAQFRRDRRGYVALVLRLSLDSDRGRLLLSLLSPPLLNPEASRDDLHVAGARLLRKAPGARGTGIGGMGSNRALEPEEPDDSPASPANAAVVADSRLRPLFARDPVGLPQPVGPIPLLELDALPRADDYLEVSHNFIPASVVPRLLERLARSSGR